MKSWYVIIGWVWMVGIEMSAGAQNPGRVVAPGVVWVGKIEERSVNESSGLVRSRSQEGVFWTHNDGGGKRSRVLYAMSRDGKSIGSHPLEGVGLSDWEDIAVDDSGHLYVADVGNNDLLRYSVMVHRVKEPEVNGNDAVRPDRSWILKFPGAPFDCESLFIWKDYGYLISKVTGDRRADVYRFSLAPSSEPVTLEYVTRLPVTSPVTGADLSVDGVRLGIVSKSGAYLFRVNGEIGRAGVMEPKRTKFKKDQIEACCFVPEGLLTTAESGEMYLFTDLE